MKEELKKTLFIHTLAALEAYQAAAAAGIASDETRSRHERFRALWEVIESARLDEEYQTWKEG